MHASSCRIVLQTFVSFTQLDWINSKSDKVLGIKIWCNLVEKGVIMKNILFFFVFCSLVAFGATLDGDFLMKSEFKQFAQVRFV